MIKLYIYNSDIIPFKDDYSEIMHHICKLYCQLFVLYPEMKDLSLSEKSLSFSRITRISMYLSELWYQMNLDAYIVLARNVLRELIRVTLTFQYKRHTHTC